MINGIDHRKDVVLGKASASLLNSCECFNRVAGSNLIGKGLRNDHRDWQKLRLREGIQVHFHIVRNTSLWIKDLNRSLKGPLELGIGRRWINGLDVDDSSCIKGLRRDGQGGDVGKLHHDRLRCWSRLIRYVRIHGSWCVDSGSCRRSNTADGGAGSHGGTLSNGGDVRGGRTHGRNNRHGWDQGLGGTD